MADDNKVLQIILDEVRANRSAIGDNDARQDARMDTLRRDLSGEIRRVHERIDGNVSKINSHSQMLAAAEARRETRRVVLKKWSTIIGSIVGVLGLVYSFVSIFLH